MGTVTSSMRSSARAVFFAPEAARRVAAAKITAGKQPDALSEDSCPCKPMT
jgi:hypothetical protein